MYFMDDRKFQLNGIEMLQVKKPTLQRVVSVFLGAIFLASAFSLQSFGNDNIALARLREVQHKISQVVSSTMGACVAVSDGVGFGSGVIVSEDGLVLTAGHVMASPDEGQYEIILPSGRTVKAKALGRNLDTDTGMVQILEKGPWPFVEMNDGQAYSNGSWVVSLGHSGGFELGRNPPVRTGRILDQRDHQILTDAVLIGGDSGGPLFNLEGELIAIHSSIGDSVAENRHVTISYFARDWDRLKRGESWGQLPELNEPDDATRRGKIGINVDRTAPNCLVKAITSGGPASQVGIEAGDIVVEFDRIVIQNGQHLIDTIKQKHAGQVCPMAVIRNGLTIRLEIMLR
jgi:serine protease Do